MSTIHSISGARPNSARTALEQISRDVDGENQQNPIPRFGSDQTRQRRLNEKSANANLRLELNSEQVREREQAIANLEGATILVRQLNDRRSQLNNTRFHADEIAELNLALEIAKSWKAECLKHCRSVGVRVKPTDEEHSSNRSISVTPAPAESSETGNKRARKKAFADLKAAHENLQKLDKWHQQLINNQDSSENIAKLSYAVKDAKQRRIDYLKVYMFGDYVQQPLPAYEFQLQEQYIATTGIDHCFIDKKTRN